MVDAGSHPNIDLMTYSELAEVGGYIGNFDVKIKRKARFVDENLCTGCDMCAQACRLRNRFPNEFDEGLGNRSPIYIAFPYAIPAAYTIDKDQCLMQTKGKCGKATLVSTREGIKEKGSGEEETKNEVPPCVAACGPNCINHDAKDEIPSDGVDELVKLTKLSQSADKFFLEAHPKLRPIDTAIDGMFIAGCAQGPKDIPDSVAQGKAASMKHYRDLRVYAQIGALTEGLTS